MSTQNTQAIMKSEKRPIIERIIRWISQAAYGCGLVILAVMALITLIDVIGRGVFNKPITGSYEITEMIFAIGVALVIGYSVIMKSHIRIDMLVNTFPKKVQIVLEIISYFICSVFFLVTSYAVLRQAMAVYSNGSNSGVLAIPLFPAYYILAVGCFLGGVMFFIYFLKVITQRKLEVK